MGNPRRCLACWPWRQLAAEEPGETGAIANVMGHMATEYTPITCSLVIFRERVRHPWPPCSTVTAPDGMQSG